MKSFLPRRLAAAAGTALLSLFVLVAASQASAAGAETVVLFNPAALETPESIQFGRHGNAYVTLALTGEVRKIAPDGTQTTNPFNTVVRVTPGGAVEVLLTAADGLDGPTAAAFGVRGDNQNLYVTNAAFPFFPGPDPRRPGIMRVHVGTPGKPRP